MRHGNLDADLDHRPEHVEIGEVNDLAVDEFSEVAEERLPCEEARDEEEERHPEGLGEFGNGAEDERQVADGVLNPEGGMFHDDKDDRQALRRIDPADALFRNGCCVHARHPGLLRLEKARFPS